MCQTRMIVVAAGPVTAKVVGASAAAISATAVVVGCGAAVAIASVGIGLVRWACQDDAHSMIHDEAEQQVLPGTRPKKHLA